MNREELLELRKEITIIEDFQEELGVDEKKALSEMKLKFDKNFELLSEDDKKWLNTEYFRWIELYLNELSCKAHGCSGCSGGCDIEF